MDPSCINVDIQRGSTGSITSFSLMADQEVMQRFCVSFPYAAAEGRATVAFREGGVSFLHQGRQPKEGDDLTNIYLYSAGGMVSPAIPPEDARELQEFLSLSGRYAGKKLKMELQTPWGRGFTMILDETNDSKI